MTSVMPGLMLNKFQTFNTQHPENLQTSTAASGLPWATGKTCVGMLGAGKLKF